MKKFLQKLQDIVGIEEVVFLEGNARPHVAAKLTHEMIPHEMERSTTSLRPSTLLMLLLQLVINLTCQRLLITGQK